MTKVEFVPGTQGRFSSWKSINVIHHINRTKNQKPYNHLHILRKSIWQKPVLPQDKNIQQTWNKRELPQPHRGFYNNLTAKVILNGGRLNVFSLRSGKWDDHSCHFYSYYSGDSKQGNKQEKEMKDFQFEEKEIKLYVCRWHDIMYRKP